MQKKSQKLRLNRETVRHFSPETLGEVRGGFSQPSLCRCPSESCLPTCYGFC